VLIPSENVKDLAEIPDNIKGNLEIKPVKWIDEVLTVALQHLPQPMEAARPETPAETPVVKRGGKPGSKKRGGLTTH